MMHSALAPLALLVLALVGGGGGASRGAIRPGDVQAAELGVACGGGSCGGRGWTDPCAQPTFARLFPAHI